MNTLLHVDGIPFELNYEFFICLVGVLILLVSLIIGVVFFVRHRRSYHDLKKSFRETTNSVRLFSLNVDKGTCICFNKASMGRKKNMTLTEFYSEFPARERDKLILWINDLLEPNDDVKDYLDINVLVNKNKERYSSILTAKKVDLKNKIIHLESYLLPNLTIQNRSNKFSFLSLDEFKNAIVNSHQQKGITFCLNFYNLRSTYEGDDAYSISHIDFYNIIDCVLPLTNKDIILCVLNDHQVLISNLTLTTRYSSIDFTKLFKNVIFKFLSVRAKSDKISFNIGAIENKLFPHEIDGLIKNASSIAEFGKGEEFITWYEEGMKLDEMGDSQYRTEVERIIRDKKLKYMYRPIYDIVESKIIGYESITKPIDTFFDSIDELKKYAAKTGDDQELFSTVSRNAISRFINEKIDDQAKIFFPVLLSEKVFLVKTFLHIANIRDITVTFVFDENELLAYPNGQEDALINQFRLLKSRGYDIALTLNDNNLTLANEIYAMFDYFIIDVKNIDNSKTTDGRRIANLHGLIERLLPFKKQIITVNIENWSAAELVIKLGIELISGEIIGPMDEMVLPLSQKSIKKINSINV